MRTPLRLSVGLALLVTLACDRPHNNPNAFDWSDSLPAGSTLHVRDGNGEITVRAARGPTTTVVASTHWRRGRDRDIRFVTRTVGNDIYVCAMWRGSGSCGARDYRGARPSGGILTMFSLFRHRTDASADFVVEVPSTVRLDAVTTNGNVSVQGADAGVVAHTINGDVRAADVGGSVSLTTVNGDVQLGLQSMEGVDSIAMRTTNGSVHAALPSDLAGRLELSTVNGDIRSDFPLPATEGHGRRTIETALGTNPRTIRLRTTNGGISLIKRP